MKNKKAADVSVDDRFEIIKEHDLFCVGNSMAGEFYPVLVYIGGVVKVTKAPYYQNNIRFVDWISDKGLNQRSHWSTFKSCTKFIRDNTNAKQDTTP